MYITEQTMYSARPVAVGSSLNGGIKGIEDSVAKLRELTDRLNKQEKEYNKQKAPPAPPSTARPVAFPHMQPPAIPTLPATSVDASKTEFVRQKANELTGKLGNMAKMFGQLQNAVMNPALLGTSGALTAIPKQTTCTFLPPHCNFSTANKSLRMAWSKRQVASTGVQLEHLFAETTDAQSEVRSLSGEYAWCTVVDAKSPGGQACLVSSGKELFRVGSHASAVALIGNYGVVYERSSTIGQDAKADTHLIGLCRIADRKFNTIDVSHAFPGGAIPVRAVLSGNRILVLALDPTTLGTGLVAISTVTMQVDTGFGTDGVVHLEENDCIPTDMCIDGQNRIWICGNALCSGYTEDECTGFVSCFDAGGKWIHREQFEGDFANCLAAAGPNCVYLVLRNDDNQLRISRIEDLKQSIGLFMEPRWPDIKACCAAMVGSELIIGGQDLDGHCALVRGTDNGTTYTCKTVSIHASAEGNSQILCLAQGAPSVAATGSFGGYAQSGPMMRQGIIGKFLPV